MLARLLIQYGDGNCKKDYSKDAVNLDQAPRILLDITVDDTPIKILFDPALQYSMIQSSIYYNMHTNHLLRQ